MQVFGLDRLCAVCSIARVVWSYRVSPVSPSRVVMELDLSLMVL